jgi:beta-galactosidase
MELGPTKGDKMVLPISVRQRELFDEGWKFCLGDPPGVAEGAVAARAFDDSAWREVTLPHDWSIEGPAPFDSENPSGSGGGYVPGGVGWYRKAFHLPAELHDKRVWIEFDGVYKNADAYLNGQHLGFHPYGYTSFYYDLTPHLHPDGHNVLVVRVDDSTLPDSRFFTGAGIYRHTWLSIMAPCHIAHWGAHACTPRTGPDYTRVDVMVRVCNETAKERLCTLVTRVVDREGHVVAERQSLHAIPARGEHRIPQRLFVDAPHRWSLEDPYLYTVYNELMDDEEVVDDHAIPLGIREIDFDADRGFSLNGQHVKLNGVCLHHDGGCVGAAVPERVWERRLELLKQMGCNAIRSSHYPPAPEFLDLCDRMGFLVMDEAFDEWRQGKVLYSYHQYYDQWAEDDLVSMLRHDRNHPSIVLWSVGNEVPEQSRPEGAEILRSLIEIVRREDPTRPITSACDHMNSPTPTTLEFAELLDVVGYNYVDRWGELKECTAPQKLDTFRGH